MPRRPSLLKKKKKPAVASTAVNTDTARNTQTDNATTNPKLSNPKLTVQQSTCVSSSSSSSSNSSFDTQPYYRGGGYCNHVYRSYDERWSDEHVEFVLKSWNMNERQQGKLMDLKQRVKHVEHPLLNCPQQLVYFLTDEGGDVDAAEKWYYESVEIRTKKCPYDMDNICETYTLPDDFDYFPICILDKYDREGDPIHITRTGAADIWGMFQRHGKENLIRHAIYYQELDVRGVWVEDYEERRGKKLNNYTYIFDLQGLSMKHVKPQLLPALGYVARIVQDTYPGLVKRVLIVHAPYVFKVIWGMVKHFFDPELRKFFIFASGDADSYKLLEKYIDPNVLPTCLHPEGEDGRVARGYEHTIMEGGPLPPGGTYKTPEYCKQGLTKAEYEAGMEPRQVNSRGKPSQQTNSAGVSCQCQALIGGNFEEETSNVRVQITSSNQQLVGSSSS